MTEATPQKPGESMEILSGEAAKDSVVPFEIALCRDEFLLALCTGKDGSFDGERYEHQAQSTLDAMEKHLEDGRSTVIRINGEIAAIGSYQQVAEKDGRPVYEVCKVLVSENFRGRRLYTKIADILEKQILDKFPNALLFADTGSDIVRARRTKQGWKPIGYREKVDLLGVQSVTEAQIQEREALYGPDKPYQAFVFDPQEAARKGNTNI